MAEYIYKDEEGNEYVYSDGEPSGAGVIGGDEAGISAAPERSIWENIWDNAFGTADNDVFTDKQGNREQFAYTGDGKVETIPETESQARRRTTATGMGVASSLLPGMAGVGKIAPAASLLSRVLSYGKGAAAASGANVLADKAAELGGQLETTSLGDDVDRFVDQTAVGTAIPAGLDTFGEILKRGGGYLKDKLATTIIPERFKTFDETMTPAQLDKSLRISGTSKSQLESAAARNRGILDLSPEDSYKAVLAKKKAAGGQIQDLTENAPDLPPTTPAQQVTEQRVKPGEDTGLFDPEGNKIFKPDEVIESTSTVPAQWKLETPEADAFVASRADPIERAEAEELLTMKKTALENDFEGSVEQLQKYKSQKGRSNQASYGKGASEKSTLESDIDRALTNDIKATVSKSAGTGYDKAASEYSDMKSVLPVARRRAAAARLGKGTVPEETVPGPWAGKVTKAVNVMKPLIGAAVGGSGGSAMGAAAGAAIGAQGSSLTPKAVDAAGRLSGFLGGKVGGAMQGVARAPFTPALAANMAPDLPGMMPEAQAEEPLPRDTDLLTSDKLAMFLMKTAQTPQAPIAQQLVAKLREATRANDLDTIEKIHSDMTKLFPDMFEPGSGVNGKLFYPEDQKRYMDNLEQLERLGVVDSIFLAKQQDAFSNPQDSRMLPMPQTLNDVVTSVQKKEAQKRRGISGQMKALDFASEMKRRMKASGMDVQVSVGDGDTRVYNY